MNNINEIIELEIKEGIDKFKESVAGVINKLKEEQEGCKKQIDFFNNRRPFQHNYMTSYGELTHWEDKEKIYGKIINQLELIKEKNDNT